MPTARNSSAWMESSRICQRQRDQRRKAPSGNLHRAYPAFDDLDEIHPDQGDHQRDEEIFPFPDQNEQDPDNHHPPGRLKAAHA